MTQLELPIVLKSLVNPDHRLISVFISIAGHTVTRQVPVYVYLKGWSFTRGWLKAGEV